MSRSPIPWAIAVAVLTATWIDVDLRLWEQPPRVIEHDVHGYYGYLPAVFIHDDIRLEKDDYVEDGHYYYWPETAPNGGRFFKYTMGSAVLYAPFFFMAHAVAVALGVDASGFGPVYKIFLQLSALTYFCLGLILLGQILLRSGFGKWTVAVTLFLIGLATNLLFYSSHSGTMPHVQGFFLGCLFLVLYSQWQRNSSWSRSTLLGVVIGLLILVRPTNAIYLFVPLLFGLRSWNGLLHRSLDLLAKWRHLCIILLMVFIVWIPQLIYWRLTTGSFILYSYQEEGFLFLSPRIMDGLFSFRKGWLVYTPIMSFSIAGVVLLFRKQSEWVWPITVILVVHTYVTFSWWCWWYGGTFGQRGMIEIYPLLAISLAAGVHWVLQRTGPFKLAGACISLFLIWLNIFQTFQFETGSLHHDGMTRELYRRQFGKMEKIAGFEGFVSPPDYQQAKQRDH